MSQNTALNDAALDQLFLQAHTHNAWRPLPVEAATLKRLYELMRMGPTAFNCQPARLVFLVTPEQKKRLQPALMPANAEKTWQAPVNVILAIDKRFYDELPKVFSRPGVRDLFTANEAMAQATATRNAGLQGGYFIMAARALGLDCGPMSGFDAAKVDAEFFPDGRFTANFLCNLGYGDTSAGGYARQNRLSFDEACQLL